MLSSMLTLGALLTTDFNNGAFGELCTLKNYVGSYYTACFAHFMHHYVNLLFVFNAKFHTMAPHAKNCSEHCEQL